VSFRCAAISAGRGTDAEFKKYGRNRLAEGKLPACAEMCSTKALLAGDGEVIMSIYKQRVKRRGKGEDVWGWSMAYDRNDAKSPAAAIKS
jgi:formate dehydrogenase iron-sulfur subunit